MTFVGPFQAQGAGFGGIVASTLAIVEGAANPVAQLRVTLPGVITFSLVSGAGATVSAAGSVSFTAVLAVGATRTIVVRASTDLGFASDVPLTFIGVPVVVVGPTLQPLTLGPITLTDAMVPGAMVAAIIGKTAGSTITMTGLAFTGGKLAVNAGGTGIIVGLAGMPLAGDTTGAFGLLEDLDGATNDPRASGPFASITVTAAPLDPPDFLVTNSDASGPGSWAALFANNDATLSGKTVGIGPGVYDLRQFTNRQPANPLVFIPTDLSNRPIIKGLRFTNSSNLTFRHLEIVRDVWQDAPSPCVDWAGGTINNITVDQCEIHHGYEGDYTVPIDPLKDDYKNYASITADSNYLVGGVGGPLCALGTLNGNANPALESALGLASASGGGIQIKRPFCGLTDGIKDLIVDAPTGSDPAKRAAAGTFNVVSGYIVSVTITDTGAGYIANRPQRSAVFSWLGHQRMGAYLGYGFQVTDGSSSVGNMTITNNFMHDLSNAMKATPTNGGTLLVEGNTFDRVYQDYITFASGSNNGPTPVVIIRWNFGTNAFSSVGDPGDPHSDFIQCFADDQGPLFSIGTMQLIIEGNIVINPPTARGYVQTLLISDSPNDLINGGTNDFAWNARVRYNILLGRQLPWAILISNLRDSFLWRNTTVRYNWADPKNNGSAAIASFGGSDIGPLFVSLSDGTNLVGSNIYEATSFNTQGVQAIDFNRYPNVVLGPQGSTIPYADVFVAPVSFPTTVPEIVAAFTTKPAFGLVGYTGDGAVDYLARTIDDSFEPSYVNFDKRLAQQLSTVVESVRTRLISGPETAAYTSVANGVLTEYLAKTGGTGTVMPASGTMTRGRFYTLTATTSAALASSVTASVTIRGDVYSFLTTTVSTPFLLADNQDAAYSTIATTWADTNLNKFVFGITLTFNSAPVSGDRLFAGSNVTNLSVQWISTSGGKLRIIVSQTAHLLIDAPFIPVVGTTYTILISVDFSELTSQEAVRVIINGVQTIVQPSQFNSIQGTRLVPASFLGTIGVLARNTGVEILDASLGMFYADWGGVGYTLIDITDDDVQNKFTRNFIGAMGAGPTGSQPKLCYYDDALATWNGALPNRGSVTDKPLTKIAGTFI